MGAGSAFTLFHDGCLIAKQVFTKGLSITSIGNQTDKCVLELREASAAGNAQKPTKLEFTYDDFDKLRTFLDSL
jgi:hypothetical protein